MRGDTGDEKNSEYRTDVDVTTADGIDTAHRKINVYLAARNPQEQLVERQDHGAKIFCKTLKQLDLCEYRTNVNKLPTETEPGGAKQDLYAITSTRCFISAIKNIAYRNYVRSELLSMTASVESYVLDIFITYAVDTKKPSTPVNYRSTIVRHLDGRLNGAVTDDTSEVSSLGRSSRSLTGGSGGSRSKSKIVETLNNEVELRIHLIGPTMTKCKSGQKMNVSVDKNVTGAFYVFISNITYNNYH